MSGYLEKPKRKPDSFNSLLIYLSVRPTPIKLMVSASLEECMGRLRNKVQTGNFVTFLLSKPEITVELFQVGDDKCLFRVTRKQYRTSRIEITGSLEKLSAVDTRITGAAEVVGFLSPITLVLILIMIVFIFALSLIVGLPFPLNVVFGPAILIFLAPFAIQAAEDRRGFIDFVQGALTGIDAKKKRIEFH